MVADVFSDPVAAADQTYKPQSIVAQSGVAVRESVPQYVYSHYKDVLNGSPMSKIQQLIDMAEGLTHTALFVGGSATVILDESVSLEAGDVQVEVRSGVSLLPSGYRNIVIDNDSANPRVGNGQTWFNLNSRSRIGAFKFEWADGASSSSIIFASNKTDVTIDSSDFDCAVDKASLTGVQLLNVNGFSVNRMKSSGCFTGLSLVSCKNGDVVRPEMTGYSGSGITGQCNASDNENIVIESPVVGIPANIPRNFNGGAYPRQPIRFQSVNDSFENKNITIRNPIITLADIPHDGNNDSAASVSSADAISFHRGNNCWVYGGHVFGSGEIGVNFSRGCVDSGAIGTHVENSDLGPFSCGTMIDNDKDGIGYAGRRNKNISFIDVKTTNCALNRLDQNVVGFDRFADIWFTATDGCHVRGGVLRRDDGVASADGAAYHGCTAVNEQGLDVGDNYINHTAFVDLLPVANPDGSYTNEVHRTGLPMVDGAASLPIIAAGYNNDAKPIWSALEGKYYQYTAATRPFPNNPIPFLSGDRSATIVVTASAAITTNDFGDVQNIVNGNLANNSANAWAPPFGAGNEVPVSGEWILYDFGVPLILGGAFFPLGNGSVSHGVWAWEGSNDGVVFTPLGGDADWITSSNGIWEFDNADEYRFYRHVGVSGQTDASAPWQTEINFIAGRPALAPGQWQLQSTN